MRLPCIGAVVIVWLGLCFLAAAQAATAVDEMLIQAKAALASGQYPEGKTLATTALSEPALPDLIRSRLLIVRGLAQQAVGAADETLLDFTLGLQGVVLQDDKPRPAGGLDAAIEVRLRAPLYANRGITSRLGG